MATEIDRNLLPGFVRTSLDISLGCAYRTFEMFKDPPGTFMGMVSEMKTLVTPPNCDNIPDAAKSVASLWVKKGLGFVEECRVTGEKFTAER